MILMRIYDIDSFPYDEFSKIKILKRGRGNPGTKHVRRYLDIVSAFDIETSILPGCQQAFMYIWQWQIGLDWTITGRTWHEFLTFRDRLIGLMPAEARMMVFVHNLSYEFQYLRGLYDFKPDEVFATGPRKVLKCDMLDRFEFRCSYLYSNMSLADFTKTRHVEHQKLPDYDYGEIRYPWTSLTDEELAYCVNDVLGLVECIYYDLTYNHDTLYTIPMTSTGFVRRDAKAAMRLVNHRWLADQFLTYSEYLQMRQTFRGGNTHANRILVSKVLSPKTLAGEKVYSYDRSSSYPDVILHHKYPGGRWTHRPYCSEDEYRDLIRRDKAVAFRLCLSSPKLRNWWTADPYIPVSKCVKLINPTIDNGRVKDAEYLEIYVTDVDEVIISDQYSDTGRAYMEVMFTRYVYLPQSYRDLVIQYYKAKTELKGVDDDAYMRSKERLNSLYGMMAQDPAKLRIMFDVDPETGLKDFIAGDEEQYKILEKYNRKAFLVYSWGVWVTAWARWELWRMARIAGPRLVYMDTDSIKCIGKLDLKEYNAEMRKRARRSGAWAKDPKGTIHYMGVYEEEGSYEEFATLGAKKYVYRQNGKLHVTIAGVTKKKGGEELEEHGGITAFKEGFTFRKAGGTESLYNDYPPMDHVTVDGHDLQIISNVVIRDSEYTLGITAEYAKLLSEDGLGLDAWTVEFLN